MCSIYISDDYPKTSETISGIVGLAGGMGGFILPIMFGALMDWTGIRSSAFMLMYGVVWVSLIWMYLEVRRTEVMGSNAAASPLASTVGDASHPIHPQGNSMSSVLRPPMAPGCRAGARKHVILETARPDWPGEHRPSPPESDDGLHRLVLSSALVVRLPQDRFQVHAAAAVLGWRPCPALLAALRLVHVPHAHVRRAWWSACHTLSLLIRWWAGSRCRIRAPRTGC